MFEFKVLGLSEAGVEISRKWPTRIISLLSSNLPIEHHGEHHLIIDVDDVHDTSDGKFATMAMIQRALDHTRDLTSDDHLLVHCFAGQSRSTAMMTGILIQHGMTAKDALEAVKENRSVLMPNRLIIALLDNHFGLEGELTRLNDELISEELRKSREISNDVNTSQIIEMRKIMDLFK